ncbi:Glycogen debranching enzyme (alpha-1,6-glucosidase) [Micromonospora rhizosphaerae]|uniref:Glycogen debranching enzyme (Alpha-1,6-glucosidase) n=1 Tax=Micromonospora rhizosphaerae TaxID=568872 RepID=A0A1C6SHG2_9ACTN|nr:glycogen debranching N-terminal domain-containing protein [Micromonospora rhizosphaerae]SCL28872.1 Glycogen debranching enzyme (alpha-1,6-glucosidase) [Micromonospora rhizosphaerae]
MKTDLIRILDGNIFVLSDGTGDIEAKPTVPCGFFSFDTRFLSVWRLTINGERVSALARDDPSYFEVRFFLVPGAPTHYVDAKVSVIRERSVAGSFEERLTVFNHSGEPADVTVRVDADCDFIPLIVVGQERTAPGRRYQRVEDGRLHLGYEREKFWRETVISTTEPAQVDEHGLTYHIRIGPHGQWTTALHVRGLVLRPDGQDVREHVYPGRRRRDKPRLQQDLEQWLGKAPQLMCDWQPLQRTYQRCLVDLAALRYSPLTLPAEAMPAAGLPWNATLTGRDPILTSLQALPYVPDLAVATLRMLGIDQGAVLDDFRDEEPGKILREFRYGELVAFEERPQCPYYGAADVTPLYVVLLDEYERWTGNAAIVHEFEDEARAALHWIDEYGDLMGDGYIWYQRRNEKNGLENQCWKESSNAICFRDGRLPSLPRATCELQGYAYDAKLRGARLARQFWNDPAYADRLERQAAELKERFNRDFWIADGEYYALALDGNGRQVDALSSNIGHLLWSGIVEESRAGKIAEHLLGSRLFSGWGVRTLAEGEGRYNPLGYHVGTVWPFDNAFIAWGLRRYGFTQEAGRIAEGIIEASRHFNGRLPEAFGGYDRELTRNPVGYPAANSPQSLATGAPLLLVRTLLGLEPYGEDLVSAPVLPERFGRIELLDIPGRWGRVDVIGSLDPGNDDAGQRSPR